MNKYFILVFIAFIFNSCNIITHPCRFEVTPTQLKSNCDLSNGLEIDKIKNITTFENEIPKNYEIEFTLIYGAVGLREKIHKIEFYKKKEGYTWYLNKNYSKSSIMPINFEKGKWYIFGDLYENGAPSVSLFVFVLDDGSFKVYRKDTPTNW